MALFQQSEYQIGRGEVAESRVEVPFFLALMVFAAAVLLVCHLYLQQTSVTMALSISVLVFGLTILRVDLGVYFLLAATLLSPEIEMGAVGRGNRMLNVRYDDILIIIVFIGVMVKQAWEGKNALWRQNPVNAGIFAYYLVCVLSTMMAFRASVPLFDKVDASFTMLKMAEFYMVFLLVGTAIRDIRQMRQQLAVFFLVAVIVSLYGVYSRFSAVERVGAPFEKGGAEPNTLGGYLMLVMCIGAGLYAYAPARRWKAITLMLIASAFVPFLFTLSRASYIAFAVSMFVLGIAGRSKLILAGMVTLVVFFPILAPHDVQDRVNYTFQRGSGVELSVAGKGMGVNVDKSTYERIYVWEKVWFNLHVWPWFGGGVTWNNVLDSQYARVIIETGVVGLAAFLFLQSRLLKILNQAHRWSRDWVARGVALGTLSATIGLMVHSLGTISFLIVRIMEPYWFLVAMCVVARDLAIEEHIRNKREARAGPEAPAPGRTQVAA